MTPSFCPECGDPLKPGARFCARCGAAAPTPAAGPAGPPAPATVAATPTAPALPAPHGYGAAPGPSGPSWGRAGGVLVLVIIAIVVMLGVGVGTAYVLTRDDDTVTAGESRDDPDRAPDRGPERDTVAEGDPTGAAAEPTATVTVTESATEPTDTPAADDPETVLREAVAADADDVLALEGSWVPQLASISDDINGSWPAALEAYERLRGTYPDALVVDAEAWPHSFIPSETFDTVLVVLQPTPASPYSAPILDWCRLHRGDRQASCYAKRIETTGSPRDNTDQNQPEPEFN